MADNNEKCQNKSENENIINVTEDYDPQLDFLSEQFDPIKALENCIRVPCPDVKSFNTLGRLGEETALLTIDVTTTTKTDNISGANSSGEPSNVHEVNKRRFLPHQEPIKSQYRRTFIERNLFTRMAQCRGPLTVLRQCMNDHKKVKVITRHGHGIRGYCTGFVEAFDKYFNIVLENVTEIWTRKKSRKIPALGDGEQKPLPRCLALPTVTVLKKYKKTEMCQRNIPKLMIRGEHVVLIAALLDSDAAAVATETT